MKYYLHALLAILLSQSIQSCTLLPAIGIGSNGLPVKMVSNEIELQNFSQVNHGIWDELLKRYVNSNGLVDYKGFLSERKQVKKYLQHLSKNPPKESWSVSELLAYYINTYNAYTVDLILENYPVISIKDINGAWTKGIVPVGNKMISLGGIENGILRKMNEPRIHFAINCASYSCPDLLNEAYDPKRIEEQLDKVTASFINSEKNKITKGSAELSSIFKWYKNDFTVKGEKNLIGFINQYSHIKMDASAKTSFKKYDWNLNEIL